MHCASVVQPLATLHVRNVPDDLYELLRGRAAANGRSLGAEAVQLLYERMAVEEGRAAGGRVVLPGLRRRRSGRTGLFSRFSTESRPIVVEAQDQAHALGHPTLGSHHLLLGVLRAPDDEPAANALHTLGLRYDDVRAEVERRFGLDEPTVGERIPFDPEAKKVLELALREAMRLRCDAIEPVHIVLGMLRGGGPGAELILAVEPDADKVRACLLRARAEQPPLEEAGMFAVVELAGSPEEWQERLNAAADEGYELVQIVGQRAIFRAEQA